MPYLGRSMSVNAAIAHKNGLLPLSSITAKVLKENDFIYTKVFFQWLCRKGYIRPTEFHHASASKLLIRYYDPKMIRFIVKTYNLKALYSLFKGEITKQDIYNSRKLEYVKVVTSGNRFGVKRNIFLDCIKVDGQVMWSHEIAIDMRFSRIEEIYGSNMPLGWKNPNRRKILRKVIIFRRIKVISFR